MRISDWSSDVCSSDVDSLRFAFEHAGPAAVATCFLAGLVFSFNPVATAAIPVSLAYVTNTRTSRQAFVIPAMFILGMIASHLDISLAPDFAGLCFTQFMERTWGISPGSGIAV